MLLLLSLLGGLAFITACGAKQPINQLGADLPALAEAQYDYPHILFSQDGRAVVIHPDSALKNASYYTLHPAVWDPSLGQEPTVGTGMLQHTNQQTFAIEFARIAGDYHVPLRVRPAEDLQALTRHKGIVDISPIVQDDQNVVQVQLNQGSSNGVSNGDWFFVLTRPTLDARQPRLGDRIGALLRVERVQRDTAIAEVIHAQDALEEGQIAVFAHKTAVMSPWPINIHIAPLHQPDAQAMDVQEMLSAVPELGREYHISNTAIHRLDAFIDPTTWDASYHAEDAAPDDGWGIVVFGDTRDNTLIYNATGFGSVPSPSGWVGILPGGLPLPFKKSMEELSSQLAVSFLSNGLGMRGDHAHAIYLVETELRKQKLEPRLRYHLREHLALRYEAIGHAEESLRLMHYDLQDAAKENDVLSQLNALSIRGYLSRQAGLSEQAVADSRSFIRLADGVLPEHAIESERIVLTRGLIDARELDEAERIASKVAAQATARGDYRQHFMALVELTSIQLMRDQPAAALLVVDELRQDLSPYRPDTRASINILSAEIYAKLGDLRTAVQVLFDNFDHFEDLSPATRAHLLIRSSGILRQVNEPIHATRALMDAAIIFDELGVEDQAATTHFFAGRFQMELAQQYQGGAALSLLLDARESFQRAKTTMLAHGELKNAADAISVEAIVTSRFDGTGANDPLFDEAAELYLTVGDFESLAGLARMRALVAESMSDTTAFERFTKERKHWEELTEQLKDLVHQGEEDNSR